MIDEGEEFVFTEKGIYEKFDVTKDKALLEKEFESTQKLLRCSALDARIGFERVTVKSA